MAESECWRDGKDLSQLWLPTTETTTLRELGVHMVRGRDGGRQRGKWSQSVEEAFWGETSCLRWRVLRQVSFLHHRKIPLDPFHMLPCHHPHPQVPVFLLPWAPSMPVQRQIHTDPCLMLISRWDAPGHPLKSSLKKALSTTSEGRNSGQTLLRISS